MTDLHSIEKLRREELSDNEKQKIFNLSYESYFGESVENLLKCDSLDKDIFKVTVDYETTAKMLKGKYANSTEAEEQDEMKISFGANVKLWFTKVWAFIVSIFQNITYSIINMIKALILYIQKKRTVSQSIYKRINDMYFSNSNGFHTHADDRFGTLASDPNYYSVKTKDIGGSGKGMTFSDIHARLNDANLHWFIYDNKIILQNKKSLFNLDTLKRFAISDLAKESSEESLATLEQNVGILAAQGIIAGEVSANFNANTNKYIELIKNGNNPKVIADLMIYGSAEISNISIPTTEFLGIDRNSSASVTKLLRMYLDDSKRIIGKGGYIDVLTEILKKYKDIAAKDSKVIKEISGYINSQLVTYAENPQIIGKFKRFTNMMVSIKSVKTKFVALRQGIIGNLLTMYSIMDYGINQLIGASDEMKPIQNGKNMVIVTDTGTYNSNRNQKSKDLTGRDGDVISNITKPVEDLYEEGDESLKN